MILTLARRLNPRNLLKTPGRRRLLVFYAMMFLFSNGIAWGGSVVEAAFINDAGLGVGALPLILIADAVVSVTGIIVYTAFVDRIRNDYLLIALLTGFIASIGLGHLLIDLRQATFAYTLLFVVSRSTDAIFLLHWWTYVGEYYDIRSFKRIAPLLLSAKTLGLLTSGLTLPLLTASLTTANIVLLWLCTQALIIVLARLLPVFTREQRQTRRRTVQRESFVHSMRDGYRYVRQTPYLRLFAVGSLALAMAAALFQSLSSLVVQQTFPTQVDYANFLGAMNIIGGLVTFPLQLFLMNRIINRIGVGSAMMLYPISTGISAAALLLFPPQVANAALGVLNRSVFRLAFRAPVMGLVYNVVPLRVRGRARAFVSGLIEPVGAVLGSLLLLAMPRGEISGMLTIVLLALVGVYVVATMGTRSLYSPTLVETLHDEEYSVLPDGDEVALTQDPVLIERLTARLQTAPDETAPEPDYTFFTARLLIESAGDAAVPILLNVLQASGTGDTGSEAETLRRLALLRALVLTGAKTPPLVALYLDTINHPDERLREAAIDGLETVTDFTEPDYTRLHTRLQMEPLPALRARLIPLVLRSPDMAQVMTAQDATGYLISSPDPQEMLLGLEVVRQTGDPGYVPILRDLLQTAPDDARQSVMRAFATYAAQGIPTGLTLLDLDALQHDPAQMIREQALTILPHLDDPEKYDAIITSLKDPLAAVRIAAVQTLVEVGSEVVPLLLRVLETDQDDPLMCEMATAALARLQPGRHTRRIEDYIVRDLDAMYHNHRQLRALQNHLYSQGVRILSTTLHEQNQAYLSEIFYLLSTLAGTETSSTVREALETDSPALRSGAIEALESIVSPRTAQAIAAQFTPALLDAFMRQTADRTGTPVTLETRQALYQLLADADDSWLRAAAVFALVEVDQVFFPARRDELLQQALNDPYADVRQAARAAQRRLNGQNGKLAIPPDSSPNGAAAQEQGMLSQIERIMFLKQVAIFESVPLEQLKALAAVCEAENYLANRVIFDQGEASGGGLYIVTTGQVAIEVSAPGQGGKPVRLATMGVSSYFGEMSLFNNRPRSATALTLQETELLKLSRVSFIRLIRQFPEMSLTLLDVLSQRLAVVNEQLAETRQ